MTAKASYRLGWAQWLILLVLLMLLWLPFLSYGFISRSLSLRSLIGWTLPIALLSSPFLALHWKNPIPTILLLVNPLTMNFGLGAADWFSNRPSMYGRGLPSSDAGNLDPDLRCYYSSGGCVIVGGEWVFDTPHNSGLRLMTALLGKPHHTYRGPYPPRKRPGILRPKPKPPTRKTFSKALCWSKVKL